MEVECGRIFPDVGLPCLSFDWEVVTPRAWKAADCGPGWIASDRDEPLRTGRMPLSACGSRPGTLIRGRERMPSAELLRVLDDRLVDSAVRRADLRGMVQPLGLGTMAGRHRPRFAQLSRLRAEIAVRSRAGSRPSGGTSRLATLEQHGLALVPFPNALVITTEARFAEVRAARALGARRSPKRCSGVPIEPIDFRLCRAGGASPRPKSLRRPETKPPSESSFRKDGRPGGSPGRAGQANDSFVYLIDASSAHRSRDGSSSARCF